jgi:hypothetical protein
MATKCQNLEMYIVFCEDPKEIKYKVKEKPKILKRATNMQSEKKKFVCN